MSDHSDAGGASHVPALRALAMIETPVVSTPPVVSKAQGVCAVLFALMAVSAWADDDTHDKDATAITLRLGKRLFVEKRFTNPAANIPASCHACHRPTWERGGTRAYCDSQRYSLIPTDFLRGKLTTLRNTPSLMDIAGHARFNHDGRFASLRDTIVAELTSRHFGWFSGDQETALDEIHFILLSDEGNDPERILDGTYVEQFKIAYAVDLNVTTPEEAVGWVAKCLAEFVASLESTRTSAFDAFVQMNRLPTGPKKGESVQTFAKSLLARVTELERSKALELHPGFGREAYAGFTIFLRTAGESQAGNCVACHAPPLFTDGAFHNTGISQAEYDATHGIGSFAQLVVPNTADASRPVVKFGPKLDMGKQVHADLGYWNFVPRPKPASERRGGGSFLATALGAFKTPTLRNLKYSDPYMHNGQYGTLEEAVAQKVTACGLAKPGELRSGDAGLSRMRITEGDIAPLVAFLKTLNDLSADEFQEHCQSGRPLVEIDQGP